MRALKGHSMLFQEIFSIVSPGWQLDIINSLSIYSQPQVELELVDQEISVLHIELWNQLFDICIVFITAVPFFVNSLE